MDVMLFISQTHFGDIQKKFQQRIQERERDLQELRKATETEGRHWHEDKTAELLGMETFQASVWAFLQSA